MTQESWRNTDAEPTDQGLELLTHRSKIQSKQRWMRQEDWEFMVLWVLGVGGGGVAN